MKGRKREARLEEWRKIKPSMRRSLKNLLSSLSNIEVRKLSFVSFVFSCLYAVLYSLTTITITSFISLKVKLCLCCVHDGGGLCTLSK